MSQALLRFTHTLIKGNSIECISFILISQIHSSKWIKYLLLIFVSSQLSPIKLINLKVWICIHEQENLLCCLLFHLFLCLFITAALLTFNRFTSCIALDKIKACLFPSKSLYVKISNPTLAAQLLKLKFVIASLMLH